MSGKTRKRKPKYDEFTPVVNAEALSKQICDEHLVLYQERKTAEKSEIDAYLETMRNNFKKAKKRKTKQDTFRENLDKMRERDLANIVINRNSDNATNNNNTNNTNNTTNTTVNNNTINNNTINNNTINNNTVNKNTVNNTVNNNTNNTTINAIDNIGVTVYNIIGKTTNTIDITNNDNTANNIIVGNSTINLLNEGKTNYEKAMNYLSFHKYKEAAYFFKLGTMSKIPKEKINSYMELGNYYLNIVKDYHDAIGYYTRANKLCISIPFKEVGCETSKIQLGICFTKINDFKLDKINIEYYKISKKYFLEEIEKNNFLAMYNLSVMYYKILTENLQNVYDGCVEINSEVIDINLVIIYLQKSSQYNYKLAIILLSNIYNSNNDETIDALKIYDMASSFNHVKSQIKLGVYYYNKKDNVTSEKYLHTIINNIDKCLSNPELIKLVIEQKLFYITSCICHDKNEHFRMIQFLLKGCEIGCNKCAEKLTASLETTSDNSNEYKKIEHLIVNVLAKYHEKLNNRKLAFKYYQYACNYDDSNALYTILIHYNDFLEQRVFDSISVKVLNNRIIYEKLNKSQLAIFCKCVINKNIIGEVKKNKEDLKNSLNDENHDNVKTIIDAFNLLKNNIEKKDSYQIAIESLIILPSSESNISKFFNNEAKILDGELKLLENK